MPVQPSAAPEVGTAVTERSGHTSPHQVRRVPTQERSRLRVERILDATATLVVRDGVDAVTTHGIARAAAVPVASIYQYFADKEDILLALAGRDMDEMDAEVAAALGEVSVADLTVDAFVRVVMAAFVRVYHRRRAFVEIYLRGRTNSAVHAFGREHNERIAAAVREFAIDAGLAGPELTSERALLAIEVGDRIFQLAFEHSDEGDPMLIEEGAVLMIGYLERYAG